MIFFISFLVFFLTHDQRHLDISRTMINKICFVQISSISFIHGQSLYDSVFFKCHYIQAAIFAFINYRNSENNLFLEIFKENYYLGWVDKIIVKYGNPVK